MTKALDRRFCVAPMMAWTDSHYRSLARIISKHAVLYTEMVTAPALYYSGVVDRHLAYTADEHPVAVQLGGSDIHHMARATQLCHQYGYDEINLNVGCPSDRVQHGMIGAVLMNHPDLVADCVRACADNTDKPITVKHRIGLDNPHIAYDTVKNFVATVAQKSPCSTFIIHARVAILKGLSPKQNRHIPPLKYAFVYQLKQDFPNLEIVINGGIRTVADIQQHLSYVDGVMVGRSAYCTPYDTLVHIDKDIYQTAAIASVAPLSRVQVVQKYCAYVDTQISQGVPLNACAKHLMGMFHAQKGGKAFRRHLSQNMHAKGATTTVIHDALAFVV